MTKSEPTTSNKKTQLYTALDSAANALRSKMDASEYKAYLLGIVFYKYLSDKSVDALYSHAQEEDFKELDTGNRLDFYRKMFTAYEEDTTAFLVDSFKYAIQPEHTSDALIEAANGIADEPFQLETFQQGLRDIERSSEEFEGLFADVDLNSRRLGATRTKQSQTIANTILSLSIVDFAQYEGDALGDAYEHLVRQFAMSAGQRAGEFYTPHEVSGLMARIIGGNNDLETKRGLSVYDATSGSGSLLLTMRNHNKFQDDINYFGQELNTTTYNLARMNMILHGVKVDKYTLRNGDTLDQDWPTEEPTDFDAVMMNPPYSAHWSQDKGLLDDPRFSPYGKLAPKTKADYAFLLHGYYHLKQSGTMAIVLPHGVLFRGSAEAKIRQKLLEDGAIEAVIGLPGGIFYSTPIPTTILILRKDRSDRDVLFIDASELYKKEKAQNVLLPEHVDTIVETYQNRANVDKLSYLASFDEIKENDFNLNIPRYVDTFEEAEPIDLADVSANINKTKAVINTKENELIGLLKRMSGTDDDSQRQIDAFLADLTSEVDTNE